MTSNQCNTLCPTIALDLEGVPPCVDENVCVALTTRVLFPSIRDDKYPRWVRSAKSAACAHNKINSWTLPDSVVTRNENRMLSIWKLQTWLDDLDRFDRNYRLWKSTQEKKWKPVNSKKFILARLENAWRYYQEWNYGN